MKYSLPDYRGNYCGPYWSNGQWQESVDGDLEAVSEFDETCRTHDRAYYYADTPDARNLADDIFYQSNIGQGIVRSVAAVAVKLQSHLRPKAIVMNSNNPKSLRGLPATSAKAFNRPTRAQTSSLSTVPAAYGYTMRLQKPTVTRSSTTARVVGSDFGGPVTGNSSATFSPAGSVPLNPCYFNGAMLGSLSRAYESFRFIRATLEYIPAVATSSAGQIVILSTRSIKEPFYDGATGSFLGKALSCGNAVATPVWHATSIELECSNSWSLVNPLIDQDIDDCIEQEVQVYSGGTPTGNCGTLILHYEIEFKTPIYTFHSTSIPIPAGLSSIYAMTDDSTGNAINDAIILASSSTDLAGDGSIYRMVFRRVASSVPLGPATWDAVAKLNLSSATSNVAVTTAAGNINMVDGMVMYGLYRTGNKIVLYSSLENALAGANNGLLVYQTVTTDVGVYSFMMTQVAIANNRRMTSQ